MKARNVSLNPMVTVQSHTGAGILPLIPSLARLRLTVFQEWPYLYAGASVESEARHLQNFAQAPGACVITAIAGNEVVGAATCLPLAAEPATLRAPFEARNLPMAPFFYFAESVLLAPYRGQGIGVEFFSRREAAALAAHAQFAVFCAVRRPTNHPSRPPHAQNLIPFWHKRGFTSLPGMSCIFSWPESPGGPPIPHELDFWAKPLTSTPLPSALTEMKDPT